MSVLRRDDRQQGPDPLGALAGLQQQASQRHAGALFVGQLPDLRQDLFALHQSLEDRRGGCLLDHRPLDGRCVGPRAPVQQGSRVCQEGRVVVIRRRVIAQQRRVVAQGGQPMREQAQRPQRLGAQLRLTAVHLGLAGVGIAQQRQQSRPACRAHRRHPAPVGAL